MKRYFLVKSFVTHFFQGGLNWHAQVFATGSSISGLDATGSDVDCCVWIPRGMCDSQFKERVYSKAIAFYFTFRNSHSALQIIHHMLIMESQREEFPFTIKDMKLRDAQVCFMMACFSLLI